MAVYKSKKVTKDGRSYFFRIKYRDILGVSHDYSSQKFKTKREAEMEESRFRVSIGEHVSFSSITIRSAYYDLLDSKRKFCKPQTIHKTDDLFVHLSPIADMKINDVDLSSYRKLVSYISSKGLSCNYNNKILGLFRQIIEHSSKFYGTSDSIIKYVESFVSKEIRKEMDFFTYSEYLQFEAVITDPLEIAFFRVLFYQGLRVGECLALTWEDLSFDDNCMKIRKTLTGKIKGVDYVISSPKTKNSNRDLPMNKFVLGSLRAVYEYYSGFDDFTPQWFVFGGPAPFNESTITAHKNKYCELAGLRQLRIHDFRHSCASFLIQHGASIVLVSKWLGHSKISTTLNTYTHMYKSELDSINDMVNQM